jgi:tryptophan-rich sensory protein
VAFWGSSFTSKTVKSDWYIHNAPSITPPNLVFPIVWSILFFLLALSIYFSWINLKNKKKIILFFSINLALNLLWSILFFGMRNPLLAFIDLILLWISILYLVIFNWKNSRISSYLLIPYLLWVTFAGILNFLFLL